MWKPFFSALKRFGAIRLKRNNLATKEPNQCFFPLHKALNEMAIIIWTREKKTTDMEIRLNDNHDVLH